MSEVSKFTFIILNLLEYNMNVVLSCLTCGKYRYTVGDLTRIGNSGGQGVSKIRDPVGNLLSRESCDPREYGGGHLIEAQSPDTEPEHCACALRHSPLRHI